MFIFVMLMNAVFLILLTTVSGIINKVNTPKEGSNSVSILSRGSAQTSNRTVYLGYANNPFGASTRLAYKRRKLKVSHEKDVILESVIGRSTGERTQSSRTKRSVINLFNMVKCVTGCNPLLYKGYGCFCGFLGTGNAVDPIDRCCQEHDWCYSRSRCPFPSEYVTPYFWECIYNRPHCITNKWSSASSCSKSLCECDRILAFCLKDFPCPSSRARCRSRPWYKIF